MQAADIYRKLRKQGTTIRKTNDGIIAATALDHHCQLLHKDKDFASMAKHFPLKVVKRWLQAPLYLSPSKLACGERGAGVKISPNSTLNFEVGLLSLEAGTASNTCH